MSMPDIDTEAVSSAPRDAPPPASSSQSTRTSRAWAWIGLALAMLVVVVVFALQNLDSVQVSFLSMHGELPLAVLLLLVAVLGALVVFAFGAARIIQLRLRARRVSRAPQGTARSRTGDASVTRGGHDDTRNGGA